MAGKRIRLARLFQRPSQRTCIFPIDHGLTLGPTTGLVDPYRTIAQLLDGHADGIILHKGLLDRVTDDARLARGNFVLHLSGSTILNHGNREKAIVGTIHDALRLGAVAVSVHVNLGVNQENQMLSDLGLVSSHCLEWGMPLIAMMYVNRETGGEHGPSLLVEHIAHAARVAEELGADVVKVNLPTDVRRFREVVDAVSIPVVVAGGAKSEEPGAFLRDVAAALAAGAAGVAVGRNVFQASDIAHTAHIVSQLVHAEAGLDECMARLTR